jgi:endonuclease YncB( thermonuclease family)
VLEATRDQLGAGRDKAPPGVVQNDNRVINTRMVKEGMAWLTKQTTASRGVKWNVLELDYNDYQCPRKEYRHV